VRSGIAPMYLNRVVTRHGKIVWIVRVGSGDERRRVRLRAEYGAPAFKAEYEAAIKADREAALAQAARNEPIKGGVAKTILNIPRTQATKSKPIDACRTPVSSMTKCLRNLARIEFPRLTMCRFAHFLPWPHLTCP
jgi:hypothetical protein